MKLGREKCNRELFVRFSRELQTGSSVVRKVLDYISHNRASRSKFFRETDKQFSIAFLTTELPVRSSLEKRTNNSRIQFICFSKELRTGSSVVRNVIEKCLSISLKNFEREARLWEKFSTTFLTTELPVRSSLEKRTNTSRLHFSQPSFPFEVL